MHFIKDLFEKKDTEEAHNKLLRYSKGEFVGPKIVVKKTGKTFKVLASFHLTDELLFFAGRILKDKDIKATGKIVWNKDLTQLFEKFGMKYLKVLKRRGINTYEINNTFNLLKFIKEFFEYNVILNFKEEGLKVSTKSSYPKPSKEFGADFIKMDVSKEFSKEILENLLFDVDLSLKFKEIKILHSIEINNITYPKDIDDFQTIRKLAKRIGKIKRTVEIDGKKKETDVKFNV